MWRANSPVRCRGRSTPPRRAVPRDRERERHRPDRGRDRGLRVGELALGRGLFAPAAPAGRPHRRPRRPGPVARPLGQRRADGDLLLRRRAGDQARDGARRAARAAQRAALPVVAALGGMVVPAADLRGAQRGAARRCARLGRSRWPPTSPSRSASWRCSAPRVPPRSRSSCWRSRSSTTSAPILVIAVFYTSEINLPRSASRPELARGAGLRPPRRGPAARVPRARRAALVPRARVGRARDRGRCRSWRSPSRSPAPTRARWSAAPLLSFEHALAALGGVPRHAGVRAWSTPACRSAARRAASPTRVPWAPSSASCSASRSASRSPSRPDAPWALAGCRGVGWGAVLGVGLLGGIGFTMALFIATLAFGESAALDQAKIGVLSASVCAATAGYLLLRTTLSPADMVARPERAPTTA